MRLRRTLLAPSLSAVVLASLMLLRADPGDVENSRDYPGFPRLPGFIITDYDEDNPAEFSFSVARPLPIDAGHVEAVAVKGHRYIIHYEHADDPAPSLLQAQLAYEKLAAAAGFSVEKTGAVGDVTETFHLVKAGREVWVCLVPSIKVNVLTIVETKAASEANPSPVAVAPHPAVTPAPLANPPPVAIAPHLAASPVSRTLPPPIAVVPRPAVTPAPLTNHPPIAVAPRPAVAPVPPASPPPVAPRPIAAPASPIKEDAFYVALMDKGRVVLPLAFLPGKPDLDADSQPVIDRVVTMLQRHPELEIDIEGHTDNSGDPQDNERLSAQRAATVRGLLIAEHVDRRRLVAVGLGGTQPVADEATAEGRAKNRRIELVLRKVSSPGSPPAQGAPLKDSLGVDSASFHPRAPNGTNYYPGE